MNKNNDNYRIKAVLFDLDGTLLNTLNHIGGSVNKTLSEFGFPTHSLDAYKLKIGRGIESLLDSSLPEKSLEPNLKSEMLSILEEYYENNINDNSSVYNGIPELLKWIASNRIHMSIITNKLEHLAKQNVDHFFQEYDMNIIGDGGQFPMKPDPTGLIETAKTFEVNPADCFYVGDSGSDMVAAKRAGMIAVGVTWGFRDESELIASGADYIVHDPLNIRHLIQTDLKSKN